MAEYEPTWRDADVDLVMTAAYDAVVKAEDAAKEFQPDASQSWSQVSLAWTALADSMRAQLAQDAEEDHLD